MFYRRYNKSSVFKQAVDDIQESLIDDTESELIEKIREGDLGAICFMLKCKGKTRGWVESARVPGTQKPDPESVKILEGFSNGDLGIVDACIHFEKAGLPVPETLKTLLAKQEAEGPDDEDYISIWDEEQIERDARRYNKMREKMEAELREFVPKRKAEVEAIKKELSDLDSFSDENIDAERSEL